MYVTFEEGFLQSTVFKIYSFSCLLCFQASAFLFLFGVSFNLIFIFKKNNRFYDIRFLTCLCIDNVVHSQYLSYRKPCDIYFDLLSLWNFQVAAHAFTIKLGESFPKWCTVSIIICWIININPPEYSKKV